MNNDSSSDPEPRDIRTAVDIDDLRDRIWDYLFKTKSTHPISDIAILVGSNIDTVRAAIVHEWFRIADERVSIA